MPKHREDIGIDIIQDVLLNEKQIFTPEVKEHINYLRRKEIIRPVICVGSGTCGTVAGASETYKAIDEYLNERDIDAALLKVGCLGMCNYEPIVDIHLPGMNRLVLKNLTEDKVAPVLDDIFYKIIPEQHVLGQYTATSSNPWQDIPLLESLPFFAKQNRVVLKDCGIINPYDIVEYIVTGGYQAFVKALRLYKPEEVCELIEESGLRGRSGGGYPTGKKWKTTYFAQSDLKYVICNAEESDPGAFMDRAIIEGNPHCVLEGIAIAAFATGASEAIVYIRSEYNVAIKILETAISQSKSLGLLGKHILNSNFHLNITIKKCPGAFVCGEETALISTIEGYRGMPETKPPYPSVSGLFDKPTLVNNVETLANVPAIIRNGPSWFSKTGTISSKGTKIFALSGKTKLTGLVEVPMGTTLRDILFTIAGGVRDDKKFKALLLGGPVGYCITEDELDTPVDFEALHSIGAALGSGGMVVIDEDNCMVDVLKFYMDFMQHQSCGKCIPCREGTKRLYDILYATSRKPQSGIKNAALKRIKDMTQLESLATVMKQTSLCGLGQSTPNPILSALKKFPEEIEEHLFDRRCRANACDELRTFVIDPEACTGCALCARRCPVNAITGTMHNPYFIIEEQCTGCGLCVDACKFNAVFVK